MAFTCGFFDSLSGDRKYNAKQISEIFDGVIRDGVYMSVGTRFLVEAGTGMQITVDSGRAWFNHTWTLNDAKFPLTIEEADLILDRIDAVVLEIDSSLETRNNQLKIIKGTPASSPQKPVLVNSEFVHQYALAYITVKKNATAITTSNIQINVGQSDCPFVTSVLEAADISTLYAQWESQFRDWENQEKTDFEEWLVTTQTQFIEWETAQKEGFNTWFEGVKGQLSEDAAGNLQIQLDDKGIQIYTHTKEGTIHKFVGNGPNGRALMTADVDPGDTFQVNESDVTAYMGSDNAVDNMAGSPYSGKWVSFIVDGNTINFKGGGGLSATDKAKLIPENIKSGVTLFPGTSKQVIGTFTDDGNASPINIIEGASAYSKGKRIDGILPRYAGSEKIIPASHDIIIANSPLYIDKKVYVSGDLNLIAGNIRKGVSIFGVTGTMQPSPEPGSFTAYNHNTIYHEMIGYLQGSWDLNTKYHAIWPNGSSGTYVGWFSLRLDMRAYRSIAVRKWGGDWAGVQGSYKFGVARTTNQGEFVTYINVPGAGESNNNYVYTLDIADVNEICYIKFESVNGGAAHGFNKIVISI